MAIEIMDGGSVIASAILVIPQKAGDACEALAARGIKGVSSANANTIRVLLDEPCDPLNTQAHVSVVLGFGGTVPNLETFVAVFPTEILVGLAANARNCGVNLLVLAIRGPAIVGPNTIV